MVSPDSLNITKPHTLLSDDAYTTTGIYLTLVGILAFTGNSFVLLVLAKGKPNFVRVHSCLLINIVVSDLIVSCTAYPLTAIGGFYHRWIFSNSVCVLSGFLVYCCTLSSIVSMCMIAVSRYILVCKPEHDKYLKGRCLRMIIVSVWIVCLAWTGLPLLGWGSYGPEPFQTSCTLNWWSRQPVDVSYNLLSVVLCFCLPLCVYGFCYYWVLKTSFVSLRDVMIPADQARNTVSPSTSGDTTLDNMNRMAKVRASRHMTVICMTMVLVFLVAWTPYAVITVVNIFYSVPLSSEVLVLPTMFCKCSCSLNPIIYCGFCKRFREATRRMFICSSEVQPEEQYEAGIVTPRLAQRGDL